MRKFGLMLLVIVVFASITVSAQKKKRIPAPLPMTTQQVVIQDDQGEGYMVFDLVTGAYKCGLCEYDYNVSGVGSVKVDGCFVTFGAVGYGYSMTAYVSLCEQKAKGVIQVTKGSGFDVFPYEEVLSDPDIRDSKASCASPEPPPSDLPAEVILQNDSDGSFLYFDPASGAYKFTHCADNTSMSGVGKVTRSGSWLSFEVIATEYRVLASVNLDAKTGKAVVDVFVPIGEMAPMQEVISDNNIADNVLACGAKK